VNSTLAETANASACPRGFFPSQAGLGECEPGRFLVHSFVFCWLRQRCKRQSADETPVLFQEYAMWNITFIILLPLFLLYTLASQMPSDMTIQGGTTLFYILALSFGVCVCGCACGFCIFQIDFNEDFVASVKPIAVFAVYGGATVVGMLYAGNDGPFRIPQNEDISCTDLPESDYRVCWSPMHSTLSYLSLFIAAGMTYTSLNSTITRGRDHIHCL
jgi:hypothetical protein